jgi:hypothetical protein
MPVKPTRVHVRAPSKTARQNLAHIVVLSEICPLVVLRILGIIARQSLVPFTIELHRSTRSLNLRIEIERLPDQAAEVLINRVSSIPMVRSASYQRK